MTFNSLQFLAFFPAVVLLYFASPQRHRWLLLLCASYYFYGCWKVEYLLLLATSTLIDYFAAILIEGAKDQARRKMFLALSLCSNLGILFAFKYLSFFNESLRAAFNAANVFYDVPAFQLLVPVGLSFYTFQAMSYSIDVYRGKLKAERHLGVFALYLSYFPQLVAGPIERASNLLPQFYEEHRFDWDNFRSGSLLALWGFFKKLVIADRLAIYVDAVYNHPADHTGAPVLLASIFFVFQIYCDFSGYSDIAKGTALIMGFRLMDNFKRPFAARSVREFWQRWHISLTRWIVDYLYYPLARKAKKQWHRHVVTILVFIVIGLWHGAAWNFVLFGAFLGLAMGVGDATRRYRTYAVSILFPQSITLLHGLHRILQAALAFCLFVLASILFRSNTVGDVLTIVPNMFRDIRLSLDAVVLPEFSSYELALAVLAIAVLETVQWLHRDSPVFERLAQWPAWTQFVVSYGLIFSILLFGEFRLRPFIYFQF